MHKGSVPFLWISEYTSFTYQCSAEDLWMADNIFHHFPEVNRLMDRSMKFKHKMEYKDMKKRQ